MEERKQYSVNITVPDNVSVPVQLYLTSEEFQQFPLDLPFIWQAADLAGANAQHLEDRGKAIGTQINCALLKSSLASLSDRWFPDLLAALVEQKRWPVEDALTWVELMPDRRRRADSLLVLAPLIPTNLLDRFLAVLRSMHPFRSAFPLPNTLFPGMDLEEVEFEPSDVSYISETLGMVLTREKADFLYVETLAKIAHYLPEVARPPVVQEVLEVVFSDDFYRYRNRPFAQIISFLSEAEVHTLIDRALRLPTLRLPQHDNPQAETLLVLLPRLAEFGYANEAVELARQMRPEWDETALCLAEIAGSLPPPDNIRLLLEARDFALSLRGIWFPSKALATIGRQLAKIGNLAELETTINLIDDADHQLWAWALTIEHVSPQVGDKILETVQAKWAGRGDLDLRLETFQCLALQLAQRGQVEEALDYLERACETALYWWELRAAILPLIARLVELGYEAELLQRVRRFQDEWRRREVLAILARYLPEPLNERVLAEVLSFQPTINDWDLQVRALAEMAPVLPGVDQADLVTHILQIGRSVQDKGMEETDNWLDVLISIVAMLSSLPASLQQEVIEEILTAARAYGDEQIKVSFLAEVISHLKDSLRQQVLDEVYRTIDGFDDYDSREEALLEIAPFLHPSEWPDRFAEMRNRIGAERHSSQDAPIPDTLPMTLTGEALRVALAEARSMNSGYGSRAEVLRKVVPSLVELPVDELYPLWRETLHDLATQRYRSDVLSDLDVLRPVIESLGGATAIKEICQAIIRTGQWFP